MEQIDDKVFGKIVGKILPESISFTSLKTMVFEFQSEKNIHRFVVEDKRIISKICFLYGISYKKLVSDARARPQATKPYSNLAEILSEIERFVEQSVIAKNRVLVALIDKNAKLVSVVSEHHKQLPLSDAFSMVDSIAKSNKAVFISKRETGSSYVVEYDVGRNEDMRMTITAYLGRNDALGRAGITFVGGGNIFVCSNQIIPHIDQDIKYKGEGSLERAKVVHTVNVEDRLRKQLVKSFACAKSNATILAKKFTESKSIKMPRHVQEHCIDLIRIKHNLPDKWNTLVRQQLHNEDDSLYGLSQALTYVGSHYASVDSEICRRLSRLGGQVVMLGKEFVNLISKSIKDKGLEVPKLEVSK